MPPLSIDNLISGNQPKDISKSKNTGAAFIKELEDRREVIVAERRRSQRSSLINLNRAKSLSSIASGISIRKADSEHKAEKPTKRMSKLISDGIREMTIEHDFG